MPCGEMLRVPSFWDWAFQVQAGLLAISSNSAPSSPGEQHSIDAILFSVSFGSTAENSLNIQCSNKYQGEFNTSSSEYLEALLVMDTF